MLNKLGADPSGATGKLCISLEEQREMIRQKQREQLLRRVKEQKREEEMLAGVKQAWREDFQRECDLHTTIYKDLLQSWQSAMKEKEERKRAEKSFNTRSERCSLGSLVDGEEADMFAKRPSIRNTKNGKGIGSRKPSLGGEGGSRPISAPGPGIIDKPSNESKANEIQIYLNREVRKKHDYPIIG